MLRRRLLGFSWFRLLRWLWGRRIFRRLWVPGVFIRHPLIIIWGTPVWVWLSPVRFWLAPRLVGLAGAPTSDPGGGWLRVDGSRLGC